MPDGILVKALVTTVPSGPSAKETTIGLSLTKAGSVASR